MSGHGLIFSDFVSGDFPKFPEKHYFRLKPEVVNNLERKLYFSADFPYFTENRLLKVLTGST